MEALIQYSNFSFTIRNDNIDHPILKDIQLDIYKGDTVGIIGASGSGKSMLLRSVSALYDNLKSWHASGTVKISLEREFDPFNDSEEKVLELRRKHVSYIMQQSSQLINPSKKLENILSGAVYGEKIKKDRLISVLQDVELEATNQSLEKYAHEFSGGQIQRILIAKALLKNPELLLVDEPTSNLDVDLKTQMLDLLLKLKEEDHTILIVSHNIELLRNYVDKIIVMDSGMLVEYGDRDKILNVPESDITRSLLRRRDKVVKPDLNSGKPIMEVCELGFSYTTNPLFGRKMSVPVFDQFNLALSQKEILGISGPSGSGKSTLANCMAGLLDTYSGSVKYEGRELSQMKAHELKSFRNNVQIIFQDPFSSLPPHYTVKAFLKEAYKLNGLDPDDEQIGEYIERFGLDKTILNRKASQLSGGQRQRCLIARALISKPKVLICDEILSSLDPHVQNGILDLILDLRSKEHMAVVFISHDKDIIELIADNIILFSPCIHDAV